MRISLAESLEHCEAFGFHGMTNERAMPAQRKASQKSKVKRQKSKVVSGRGSLRFRELMAGARNHARRRILVFLTFAFCLLTFDF
jgi:hypothetical protein